MMMHGLANVKLVSVFVCLFNLKNGSGIAGEMLQNHHKSVF
jgi:hypothetical protein